AQAFVTSDEFRAGQIDDAYQALVGHDADAAGLGFWLNALKNGVTLSQIEVALLTSPEYIQRVNPFLITGAAYLDSLYRNVLGRAPKNGEVEALMPLFGFLM